jgi:hypothetical protein
MNKGMRDHLLMAPHSLIYYYCLVSLKVPFVVPETQVPTIERL